MKIKYFQALAEIRKHLDNIVYHMDNENKAHGDTMIGHLGITRADRENIVEEAAVLNYLIGCQVGVVSEKTALKPSSEVAVRCFRRHLAYLEGIYGEGADFHSRFDTVRKQYKACIYYTQMFMDSKWYEKMPSEIRGC